MSNECRFYPVQCSENKLQTLNPQEGHVYFTTDTKKIYLGKNNEMIPMCAATGFYYGTKKIPEDNSGAKPNPNVDFHITEIEGTMVPEVDDLILNIDGCFYRVKSIEEDIIKTVRLTLQGTGTGGSGGGGSNNGGVDFEIQPNSINKTFSSTASSMIIEFTPYMYNPPEEDAFIKYISCTMDGEDEPFFEKDDFEDNEFRYNEKYTIDLIDYVSNFSTAAAKSFTLLVKDVRQNSHSIKCKIQLTELGLRATQEEIIYSDTGSYEYSCYFSGGSTLNSRKLTFTLYNENSPTKPVWVDSYSTGIQGDLTYTLDISTLSHGVYKLEVQGSGYIGNGGGLVESNIIEHKFICFDATKNEPILTISLPKKLEQYSNIPLKMLVLTSGASKEYDIEIKINNKIITTQKITTRELLTYPLSFDDIGEYTLTVSIPQLNLTQTQRLIITKYSGNIPTIETTRDDLLLYLNPKGKTNNAIDRAEWISSNENNHKQHIAKLNNFYFGGINGWVMDEDSGASYLRLSQGATLTLPTFEPFADDAMASENHGMTIELDFKLSAVTDYDADIIRCMSVYDGVPYCGFRITGNRAELYTSINNGTTDANGVKLKPFTVKLLEDQRIKISYVIEKKKKGEEFFPLILTYFNGIISSIDDYDANDHFVQSAQNPATLFIDSSKAQIDLYSIRFYSGVLNQTAILENYQASLDSLAEREANYNSNNILVDNQISLEKIETEGYPLEIPYVKISGGFNSSKDMIMGVPGSENGFGLPTNKKDYRLIDFELKYPKTGYFADEKYQDFSEICTFESGKTATDINPAYGETPLTGAVMYAQGTSSLEYPVKNLRIKFKTKKIAVRPDLTPVNLICLKADFMESSGSHNTGAANYIDEVYNQAGMKTPGQEYYSNEKIVTSIKGHPVLVFWSASGKDGTYQYIGKYNLNLDKATPEPFGFKNDPEVYDPNAEKKFGWDENGKNTIRCFEYLDNDIEVCNFQSKPGKTYEETWYELITDPETGKSHYGWTEGFESRHPEDLNKKTDADDIYPMAKWVNELYELSKTDKDQAIARFANEYECYFNKDFLLAYYSITNLLLMTDSRTKNCMMASWGPEGEKSYYPLIKNEDGSWVPDESQTPITNNYFIWYPIFYDMDTMLGLDNQGYQNKNYYDTDAAPKVFNGKQILWNFVRDALPGEVTNYYERFESASNMFTAPKIITYFNNRQASLANEAMYNEDAEYKYINPFRTGYFDYKNLDDKGNPTWVEGGSKDNKLYAAQGSRELDREYFIKHRVNFLRGKYQSPKFLQEDRINFRSYTPAASEDSEEYTKIQNTLAAVPFDASITLDALGPGFGGIKYGNTIPKIREFTNNNLRATIEFPSTNDGKNDQETYIYGLSNLKNIGDLSNKYPATFVITNENKLEVIKLGNDHKDYYNPYWQLKSSPIDFSNCPLLKTLNMYNCTYSEGLNLSKCKQLENILLTGSSVSSLILPEGTIIKNLRLPGTLETLSIKNQHFVENFSFGPYEYADNEEYMTDNTHYKNNYKRIRYVEIVDTPIDSYAIAIGTPELQTYKFTNVNWNITQNDTQYILITETEFDNDSTYYERVDSKYIEYEGTSYKTGLFRKVTLINEDNTITYIPVLEKLLAIKPTGGGLHADALTGIIHFNIVGEDGAKISVDEYDMSVKYRKYYPNLKFDFNTDTMNVKEAYDIYFYNVDAEYMNDNIKPDYEVLGSNEVTLATLTGENSPTGEVLFTPTRAPTERKEYIFTGIWMDWTDNNKEYYQDDKYKFENVDTNYLFSQTKPQKNMKLIPQFKEIDRNYDVSFIHNNSSIVDFKTPYESILYKAARDFSNMWYIYEPDYNNGLAENERVAFKGWINEEDFTNNTKNPSILDLKTHLVTESQNFYSHFEKEDATKHPSVGTLFEIGTKDTGFSVAGVIIQNKIGVGLNPEISGLIGNFGGKMTLPRVDNNGNDIKIVGYFSAPPIINNTEIYFVDKDKAQYEAVIDYAFDAGSSAGSLRSLKAIYLPDTITAIGSRAFRHNTTLELANLPSNLTTLGEGAFEGCSAITISELPKGVTRIPLHCFIGCTNIAISKIGMENQHISIGNQAFMSGAGSTVTDLWLGKNVTIDDVLDEHKEVFAHDGYPNLTTVYYYNNYAGCGSLEELRRRLFGNQNRSINWVEITNE